MKYFPLQRVIVLFLTLAVSTSPLLAQQKTITNPKPSPAAPAPDPTFDTLLAADTFNVYAEVRGVGALTHSSAVTDILDPLMKMGNPPKEFKLIVKWLNAHADTLAGSRLLVAGWPSRPGLPDAVVAVEFASADEAKKFYPELSGFLPKIFPTPTPEPSPTASPAAALNAPPAQNKTDQKPNTTAPPSPPYQLKQIGALVLISDAPFNVRDLRPRGSRGLEEDPNFAMARTRFASESVFVYIDFQAIQKEETERQKKWQEEEKKNEEARRANPPAEEKETEAETGETGGDNPSTAVLSATVVESSEPTLRVGVESIPSPSPENSPANEELSNTAELDSVMSMLWMGLFSGAERRWPEGVGLGVNFEGDSYVARGLIINGEETKDRPIPFVPQFISGPAIVPQAPEVVPADLDLFVTVSLNYQQIYENTLKALESTRVLSGEGNKVNPSENSGDALAGVEKKLGLKIKQDLLPLLGNEFAFAVPKPAPKPEATEANAQKKSTAASAGPGINPIIAIGIKDRDAVSNAIPKILEAAGLKGANLIAQKEKRDNVEIVSYGPFSYALIENFFVFSTDAAQTRRTVDAYLNHQTLSSDSHYRNYTRWQPHQVLGQLYVGPTVIQEYMFGSSPLRNASLSDYLAHVSPMIDPVTYSLTNDGSGSFHELHVPRNLVQMLVATSSSAVAEEPLRVNEYRAQAGLRSIAEAEARFRMDKGAGSYGTMEQLMSEGVTSKELVEGYGYRIELIVSSGKFEATAVPIEYGTTGRLSFFIDESNTLRGGDHGGGPATVADQPLDARYRD